MIILKKIETDVFISPKIGSVSQFSKLGMLGYLKNEIFTKCIDMIPAKDPPKVKPVIQ